jgi:hypothetical protein
VAHSSTLHAACQENEFELEQEGRRGVAMWPRTEAIYERPGDYDLEHEGDDEDIPRAAVGSQVEIGGLEREGPMLDEAVELLFRVTGFSTERGSAKTKAAACAPRAGH